MAHVTNLLFLSSRLKLIQRANRQLRLRLDMEQNKTYKDIKKLMASLQEAHLEYQVSSDSIFSLDFLSRIEFPTDL